MPHSYERRPASRHDTKPHIPSKLRLVEMASSIQSEPGAKALPNMPFSNVAKGYWNNLCCCPCYIPYGDLLLLKRSYITFGSVQYYLILTFSIAVNSPPFPVTRNFRINHNLRCGRLVERGIWAARLLYSATSLRLYPNNRTNKKTCTRRPHGCQLTKDHFALGTRPALARRHNRNRMRSMISPHLTGTLTERLVVSVAAQVSCPAWASPLPAAMARHLRNKPAELPTVF